MSISKDIWLDIIAAMQDRRQIGLKQYGVPVTADPNVNWRLHLQEELLDALVYNIASIELDSKYKKLLSAVATLTGLTEAEVEAKYAT